MCFYDNKKVFIVIRERNSTVLKVCKPRVKYLTTVVNEIGFHRQLDPHAVLEECLKQITPSYVNYGGYT